MKNLAQLQNKFFGYILHSDDTMVSETVGVSHDFKVGRLDIYRNAYTSRLMEVLVSDFPVLHALLGEDHFSRMGFAYIKRHPSTYFNIRDFTQNFPQFLQQAEDFGEHPQWLMFDLAWFEWHLSDAIDTGYDFPLSRDQLSGLELGQWPMAQFKLQCSARVICLKSNAVRVWEAHEHKFVTPSFEWLDSPVYWLIWRRGIEVMFRQIPPYEVDFIDSLKRGLVFGECCGRFVEYMDEKDIALNSAQLLQRYLDDELLVGFSVLT